MSQRSAIHPVETVRAKKTPLTAPSHLLAHGLLIVISAAALMPVVWMLSTALKAKGTELEWPIRWIPDPVVFDNFIRAHTILAFGTYYRNTIFIALAASLGATLTSSMAGFAFSRLRFVGRGPLFVLVLATLMLPNIVTLIPTYIIYRTFGWIDTFGPLILPSWLGGGAFNVFLMRQFFMTLPHELDDAARVDGASSFRIYAQILLPLCGPVLAVVAIFSFVEHWTEFLLPLIYLNSDNMRTVSIGLALGSGTFRNTYNYIMAVAFTMTLPIIVLFFSAQRYFMKGIVMTGMAGR